MLVKKISIILYIQLIILLMIVIEYFYFYQQNGTMTESSIEILKYELLFIYIWTIVSAKQFLPWKHLYFLFLLTMGIFQYNRIFLDILGLYHFNYESRWGYFYFPTWTSVELLLLFILGLSLIHMGLLLANYFFKEIKNHHNSLEYSDRLFQIGKLLFWISFPLFTYKLMIQVQYIAINGYLTAYTDLKSLHYPAITKGTGTLLTIGYSFILASIPRQKSFLLYSFFFLVSMIGIMLQGARGSFIVSFLFMIWYFYKFYVPKDRDINIKIISIVGVLFIILSQAIFAIRLGYSFNLGDISKNFIHFFSQQGTSILVPFNMIYYKNDFIREGLPYVLDPLLHLGTMSFSQTEESLHNLNSLAHHISYYINPHKYLNGEGMGSSYIGLLYDLPLIFELFSYIFIGYFIAYFDKFIDDR